MNQPFTEQIADAVLYEGYLLYPYRPSALKNRVRWLFGRVFPEAWCASSGNETSALRTEFLIVGDGETRLSVRLRFLHIVSCTVERTESSADGSLLCTTQEAVPRSAAFECHLAEIADAPNTLPFAFPASSSRDILRDAEGRDAGVLVNEQRAVHGTLEVSAVALGDGAFRVAVEVRNRTPLDANESGDETAALESALVSTHLLLNVDGGDFVSLRDPPEPLSAAAGECRQSGLWPVLVGREGARTAMLAAPIILDDYPRIAPESVGDLFDGTEIDELLTLRVRTLSDAEKQEIRAAGGRAAALLDRAETLGEDDLRRLHGTVRDPARPFRPGDRVRLRPRGRADAFDHFLAGRTAVVTRVERDFEDREHVAVTLDDDPGRDLGELGMPGHRFFFRVEELEPLEGKSEIRMSKSETNPNVRITE
jgi:hypothetical protein